MSKFRLTAILSLIGSTPVMAADCGPGPHWIDSCPAGTYSVPTMFDVTIKEQPCNVEGGSSHHVILRGETQTNRQAALTEPDHHIDTEIVSLSLTGDGYFFRAGKNEGLSQQSLGRITEMGDPNWARLYFDIFFQIKLPASIMGGATLHNNDALRKQYNIDLLPPAEYKPPTNERFIIPLFNQSNAEVACFIKSAHKTSVTLSDGSFTATATNGVVNLSWKTADESNNAGFFVWRGELKAGKTECVLDPESYTEVKRMSALLYNDDFDASYSYEDKNVESGNTYCYALEDVDLTGKSTFHLDDLPSATVPY